MSWEIVTGLSLVAAITALIAVRRDVRAAVRQLKQELEDSY